MSFYNELIQVHKKFNSLARIDDIMLLEPKTLELVQAIIADAAANGLQLMIYDTYRSQQRQQYLFNHGATKLRTVGVHHYGLACDIVKNINGEPSWKGDFSLIGQLAHHHGLIWGGDWGTPSIHHTFLDNDHVQRCSVGRQAALFNGTFYPDENYNPYNDLQ